MYLMLIDVRALSQIAALQKLENFKFTTDIKLTPNVDKMVKHKIMRLKSDGFRIFIMQTRLYWPINNL